MHFDCTGQSIGTLTFPRKPIDNDMYILLSSFSSVVKTCFWTVHCEENYVNEWSAQAQLSRIDDQFAVLNE